ncbi:MAG: FHA domain-containing protein [bacterium]|nr:FHA domain-containing protein [bacterium]
MNVILATAEDCTPYNEVAIEQYPATIGRGAEADVLLNDRWASRVHCRIDRHEDGLLITDLNSKHGTFINGKAITQAKLLPGDRISIGLTVFVAHVDSATVKSY